MDLPSLRDGLVLAGLGFLLVFFVFLYYYLFFAIGYWAYYDSAVAWLVFALIVFGGFVDMALVAKKCGVNLLRNFAVASVFGAFGTVVVVVLDEFLFTMVLSTILFNWGPLLSIGAGLLVAMIVFAVMEMLDFIDVW